MEMGAGDARVAVAAAVAAVVAAAADASEDGRWRRIGGPAVPAAPAAVPLGPPFGPPLAVEAPLGGGSCGMCSKWMRKPIKKRSSCVSR